MSKYVKGLIADEFSRRLEGVNDLLTVNVIGMDALSTYNLRKKLREKKINLLVVRNSLARRATEGTKLAPAFEGSAGSMAVIWGGEDFVSLAKELVALKKDKALAKLEPRGGVMDGEALTAARVEEISKWPNRLEMLSILSGQLLGPGATLNAQLLGPGGELNSQIEEKSKEKTDAPAA
jgi:large subunit ribosomal protein L10